MTVPLIVGNWKMNTFREEAMALARACAQASESVGQSVNVGVCPPFPWLVPVKEAIGDSPLQLGAQDCAAAEKGAFTGDVAASMLANLCSFTLVGHSERRTHHSETDEDTRQKTEQAIKAGLNVILCVGETEQERSRGDAESVVRRQISAGLRSVGDHDVTRITIAYEPVWAIGTGIAATEGDASNMATVIRRDLEVRFAASHGSIRILYGGSANDKNAATFLAASNVDGLLVGSASLLAEPFTAMVHAAT